MKQDSLSGVAPQGGSQCNNESACFVSSSSQHKCWRSQTASRACVNCLRLDNGQESRNSRKARWLTQKGTYRVPSRLMEASGAPSTYRAERTLVRSATTAQPIVGVSPCRFVAVLY